MQAPADLRELPPGGSSLPRHERLVAALIAAGCLAAACGVGSAWARHEEAKRVVALAARIFEQRNQGSALQRAAFREPRLLPLYGSSELVLPHPWHPSAVFRERPTGFTVFPVGKPGTTCLVMLQNLAALGSDLRGKKVALSLSPIWFFERFAGDPKIYAGNFSPLHAAALIFHPRLSLSEKRGAARRMAAYPETLRGDAVLRFGVARLAAGRPLDLAAYYLCLPLGRLRLLVLRLQDHWHTGELLRRGAFAGDLAFGHAKDARDWPELAMEAEARDRERAGSNPFGIADELWTGRLAARALREQGAHRDADFLAALHAGQEWVDLRLLLDGLRELGARPLLLSMPLKGAYYDHLGLSAGARAVYYQMLQSLAAKFKIPVVDFHAEEDDLYFLQDLTHLGGKGWVSYDRVLDDFYHGRALDR